MGEVSGIVYSCFIQCDSQTKCVFMFHLGCHVLGSSIKESTICVSFLQPPNTTHFTITTKTIAKL